MTLDMTLDMTSDTADSLLEHVHHELRTPLAALLGHVELLEESATELPFRMEISLQAIHRAGDRLREVLAELDGSVTDTSV